MERVNLYKLLGIDKTVPDSSVPQPQYIRFLLSVAPFMCFTSRWNFDP